MKIKAKLVTLYKKIHSTINLYFLSTNYFYRNEYFYYMGGQYL